MANITASMVKELRERTGAGMMDCKNALTETDGDMEAAGDLLRTKGLAKAAKKGSRVAAEGLVGIAVEGNSGAAVEVNSETDFVARNEQFQQMVSTIAGAALRSDGDLEKLTGSEYPGSGKPISDYVTEMVGTIGENMTVRRTESISVGKGVVASYVHNQAAPGIGKIGVLVGVETEGDAEAAQAFGRKIAMHVASVDPSPLALTSEGVDPAVVDHERQIFTEQARESGKPDNIIEKMVEGRIRKFYQEVALMSQSFVMDPDNTIEQTIKNAEAEVGAPVKVTGFVRMKLGEGIDAGPDEDFADEVAKTASGG
ncbi:MAG: translation elongation factor Ts [Hyphomicrobiales bacterium]|nr:translation elongation factor Ts [Hyphomicrobiales bacterium]